MSKSRNTTPIYNLPGASSTPSATQTADIPISTHNPNTDPESINEHRRRFSYTMRSHIHDLNPRSPIVRGVVRSAEHELEQPSAKRIRAKSVGSPERFGGPASPSSDSQGGMADSEAEAKHGGDSALGGPPPKKKRTRTLTTPHQAAVLHALLAQSRFPTTAMREEVGRSIGLSARKVQIWFQNQRQKARRPRNQGDATSNRAHQFGPYPNINMPHSAPASSYPMMSGIIGLGLYPVNDMTARGEDPANPLPDRFRHQSVPLADSVTDDTPRLLGPGMPGSEVYGHRPSRGHEADWPVSAPPAPEGHFSRSQRRYGSPPPPTLSPAYLLMARPATSQPRGWIDRDMSRTLPPLIQSRPATSAPLGLRHSYMEPAPSSHASILPMLSRRSGSPEGRFAHELPDAHGPSGRSGITLPPPYTLQPPPQWDNSAYPSISRPPSSWSRPASNSSDRRSTSPPPSSSRKHELLSRQVGESSAFRKDFRGSVTPPPRPQPHSSPPGNTRVLTPPPSSRRGRYDPIREIYVPFTKPSSPPTQTQSLSQSQDEKDKTGEPSEEILR